ncbi:metallophosphoesterase [Candidatus Bathyarchaeota archaeon]|nr:metallophosphoesterase [Candidatus Bathyarchaeota archaeon]
MKIASPYAALIINDGDERTLVISDLHIGWEISLAGEGIYIPSQTKRLLMRLKEIIFSERPDRLIILGDVKHTIAKIEAEEWRDVPDFFENVLSMISRVQIVPGNHDGEIEALLPDGVELLPSRGIIIGDVGVFHGHTWPLREMLNCRTLVIGHVHPVITFRDPMGFRITRQVWVKAPCNSKMLTKAVLKGYGLRREGDENFEDILERLNITPRVESLIIMPSFNDFLGGQPVNAYGLLRKEKFEGFIGPVLRSGSIDFNKAEIYLLDGTFLGHLGQIKMISEDRI